MAFLPLSLPRILGLEEFLLESITPIYEVILVFVTTMIHSCETHQRRPTYNQV